MHEGYKGLHILQNFCLKVSLVLVKSLGTADVLLLLTRYLQASLDRHSESMVISLDSNSAFELVNHQALLFNVFKEFLFNQKQCVTVDGKFSQFRPVVSGGSVLGLLLFILFTADMYNNLENKIVSYADDTTLYSEISTPPDRIKVADSLNRIQNSFNHCFKI